MQESFRKFRDSGWFVVITTIFPVVAVVATILLYLNAETLRNQATAHRTEISGYQNRVAEKDAQIVLLNEQIKQKTTQAEILQSQVELLQKVNVHQDSLAAIERGKVERELESAKNRVFSLEAKLKAFETLNSKFGKAEEIAKMIAQLQSEIESRTHLKNASAG